MERHGLRRWLLGAGATALIVGLLGVTDCDSGSGADVELVILHTNDIHYRLHPDGFDPFQLGGVARLATRIAERRKEHAHAITLDAGDWSETSWYYNVDGGEQMLRMMARMGYDAAVVGNHDYLNGPDFLAGVVKRSGNRFPILASNVEFSSEYSGTEEFRKYVRPSWIIERAGLKIGVIGLTNVDYPFAPFFRPARATDPIEAAKVEAKRLRPQVDLLILLSHNGFGLNEHLAKTTLGVDAVISGHSHTKKAQAVLVDNAGRKVPVVETGAWGKFVGELKFKINPKTKKVTYVSSQLLPVDASLEEDTTIAAEVVEMDAKLRAMYGETNLFEPVVHSDIDIGTSDDHVASTGALATKAYRKQTGAQIAMEALALMHRGFRAGPISIFDLHEIQPHIFNFQTGKHWTLKQWSARGSDLALIASVLYSGVNLFADSRAGLVSMDGLEVTWVPKGEGEPVPRVVRLMVGDEPLQPGNRYSVAMLDGMWIALNLANEQFHLGMDMSQVVETGLEGWRGIVDYAALQGTLTEAGLRDGGRSYTTTPDGAIAHYGIRYEAGSLRVKVANDGLQRIPSGGRVECRSGKPDDKVAYDSEAQVWTPIGEGAVGALEPGHDTWVSMSWTPKKAVWPVSCSWAPPVGTADGYAGNNSASTVFVLTR